MLRLLLVTDDPDLALELEILLVREGVDFVVPKMREGLANSVAADPPDAAVIDLDLPGREGWDLLQALRKSVGAAAMPIVALVGPEVPEEGIRAFSQGADEVLLRPFDPAELALRALASMATLQDRSASMRGSLEVYPLPELLQSCERGGWSGTVRIAGDAGSSRIQLRQGKIVVAESGELRGVDALRAALDNTRGELLLNAGAAPLEPPPLVPSVRRLLLDAAWSAEEAESSDPLFHVGARDDDSALAVVSIFYTRAARSPLRAFLALLPSDESLPVSLAGEAVERGERTVSWRRQAGPIRVRYQPLALESVSEIFQRAGEAKSVVLWLGPDLTADGIPMPLQLLQTAARQAEQMLLVTEPPEAAQVLLSELDGGHRWQGAPGSLEGLVELLWGIAPEPPRPASAWEAGLMAEVIP